jgi:hypothetical protein
MVSKAQFKPTVRKSASKLNSFDRIVSRLKSYWTMPQNVIDDVKNFLFDHTMFNYMIALLLIFELFACLLIVYKIPCKFDI